LLAGQLERKGRNHEVATFAHQRLPITAPTLDHFSQQTSITIFTCCTWLMLMLMATLSPWVLIPLLLPASPIIIAEAFLHPSLPLSIPVVHHHRTSSPVLMVISPAMASEIPDMEDIPKQAPVVPLSTLEGKAY